MTKYLILFIVFFATPLMWLSEPAGATEIISDNVDPAVAESLNNLDEVDFTPVSKKSRKIENRESYVRSLIEKKYTDKEIQDLVKRQYSNSKDQEILKSLSEKYSPGKILSKDSKVLRTDRLLALSVYSGKNQESKTSSDQEVRRIVQMILQKEKQLNLPSSNNLNVNRIEGAK